MDLGALHFIRPGWLLAIPAAWLLSAWLTRAGSAAGDWRRVCDEHLLRWLGVRDRERRGWTRWLPAVAASLAALALSGPSWERLPDTSFSARTARVIVLDLSRSMLAEDLRPDRMTRARFQVEELLDAHEEGTLALVSFAGDAYVVAPLTSDVRTIGNLLPALRPDIMPVQGSRADRGLDLAATLLQRAGHATGEVLLIADGVDREAAERAEELADAGYTVHVLAVGTADGAPIPANGGFVTDRAGNVVIPRLDRDALRAVAEAGAGRYHELGAEPVRDPWRSGTGLSFEQRDDGLGERWKDAGPWLVLMLLPFALVGFRRGLLFVLPVLMLPLVSPKAHADGWDDAWQRPDQQAHELLRRDNAERAAEVAPQIENNPMLAGEAWFRAGDPLAAAQAWSALDTPDAHYNRGNALAHAGELERAIAAYDQALAQDPSLEDALYNKALVEQMLEQERQQQEQQQGEGEQGEEEGEPQPQEDEGEPQESDQQQGDQDSEQEGEPQPGEPGAEAQQQAWDEEDEQAMERWLQRIPDDPGGLLRRKFRNQHQRRGAPEEEQQAW